MKSQRRDDELSTVFDFEREHSATKRKIAIIGSAALTISSVGFFWWVHQSPDGTTIPRIALQFVVIVPGWSLCIVQFVVVIVHIIIWRKMSLLYGLPSREVIHTLRKLERLRQKGTFVTSTFSTVLILGMFALLFKFIGSPYVVPWFLFYVGGTFFDQIKMSEPVTILFLGNSRAGTNELLARCRKLVRPFRLVALLSADSALPTGLRSEVNTDNYRTRDDTSWHGVVDELANLCPIVAFDARYLSSAVLHEASLIADAGVAFKVLCVVGNQGEHPALDTLSTQAQVESARTLAMLTEDKLPLVLGLLVRSPNLFPSRDRPMSEITSTLINGTWPPLPSPLATEKSLKNYHEVLSGLSIPTRSKP